MKTARGVPTGLEALDVEPFDIRKFCSECPYKGNKALSTEVSSTARVMLLGEAPAKEETEVGRNFVGASGRLLTRYLRTVDRHRSDVSIGNIIRCKLQDNLSRTEKDSLVKELSVPCGRYALYDVLKLKPKIVVLLGKPAIHYFVKGNPSVLSVRGKVFYSELAKTHIICTYHPAAVMRDWSYERLIIHDLGRAFQFIDNPDISVKPTKYKIARGLEESLNICEYLRNQDEIVYDVETDALEWTKGDVLSWGFSAKPFTGVTIPFKSIHSTPLTQKERIKLIDKGIKPLLESSNKKVGQNIGFDCHWALNYDIHVNNIHFDTMLAHHLIDENFPLDLDTLADFYTDMGTYADELKSYLPNKKTSYNVVPDEVLWLYGCKDCDAEFRIKEIFNEKLDKEGVRWVFENITMPLIDVILRVERRGVYVDRAGFAKADAKAGEELLQLSTEMSQYSGMGEDFNPNSTKQLQKILFDVLELPKGRKTKTGYSTDDKVLEQLDGQHEFIELLRRYRTVAKFKGTYLDGTKVGKQAGLIRRICEDGRIHTSYKIPGTGTGRLSSSNPNCYDDLTEVLTDSGWKLFKDLIEDDKIAQRHSDGGIDFVKPTAYIDVPYKGKMIHIKAFAVDLLVTPNHRMFSLGRKKVGGRLQEEGILKVDEAKRYLKWYQGQNVSRKFIRGGMSRGGKKLSHQEKLSLARAVAIQADGYLCKSWPGKIELRLKSERKKLQLLELYPKERIRYYRDMIRVWVDINDTEVTDWLTLPNKDFRPEKILQLCIEDLKFFINEVFKWDGDFTKRRTYLQHSKHKVSSDVIQAAAILSNMSTSWYVNKDYNVVNFHPKTHRSFGYTFTTEEDYNGRVYCVEVPAGALVVRRKNLAVISGNCQNIPRGEIFRPLFIAAPGYKLVIADFERGELYGAAHLSRDVQLKRALQHDVHRLLAAKMFDKRPEDVTKEERIAAKTVIFGIQYGRGPDSIAKQLKLSRREAIKYIIQFFDSYPQLEAWIKRQHEQVERYGFVRSLFGRKRHLYGIFSVQNNYLRGEILRQAQNMPVQGTLADIGHLATIDLDKRIQEEKLDASIVLLVHDEIVVETREDLVPRMSNLIKECFEKPRKNLQIPVEILIGDKWSAK